jgi:hypothetical protein
MFAGNVDEYAAWWLLRDNLGREINITRVNSPVVLKVILHVSLSLPVCNPSWPVRSWELRRLPSAGIPKRQLFLSEVSSRKFRPKAPLRNNNLLQLVVMQFPTITPQKAKV